MRLGGGADGALEDAVVLVLDSRDGHTAMALLQALAEVRGHGRRRGAAQRVEVERRLQAGHLDAAVLDGHGDAAQHGHVLAHRHDGLRGDHLHVHGQHRPCKQAT